MKYFEKYFDGVDFSRGGEVKVCCPFHNDTVASASVNVEKSLFRCNACGEGHGELSFLAKLQGISTTEATKVLSKLGNNYTSNWGIIEKAELWADATFLAEVQTLGLSTDTIDTLNLGLVLHEGKKFLGVPVMYNGVLLDVRRYNLLKHEGMPKMIGNANTETGMVIPYDLWKTNDEITYIFEGEKDMLIGRELGLNAITLTGGASAVPNELVLPAFKNKDVVVCYDNDEAGRNGMIGIFKALHKVAKSVKYIDISEVVSQEKEDLYDAVHKYDLDAFMFSMLEHKEFPRELLAVKNDYITLKNALDRNVLRKRIKSVVNVSAEYSDTYALPSLVTVRKDSETTSEAKNTLPLGYQEDWVFDKNVRSYQLLELVEADANKDKIHSRIKSFLGINPIEVGMSLNIKQYETVYRVKVIDTTASTADGADEHSNISLDLYTFDKMDAGHEYEIEYTIYPHPNKNQKVVAIATKVETLNAEATFMVDKGLLSQLQTTGTVEERVEKLYQSAKHHIAKHLNKGLWLMMDLVFNSFLEINYGVDTWGALDIFVLGDTSTGKSETAKGLNNLYNFGHFVSLKNATTTGLIGGSRKDGENMLNTIGAIPRQHRKLVVLEEFSGADPSFIKTMTDIRTSRRVHIVRVAGELDVPCNLRMITISNPIGDERGLPKYLGTFPNGVMPLMELINNPEDVGRYDGFFLMPTVEGRKNPFGITLKGSPIPKEVYEHKAQWNYTRKKENVIWEEGVEGYIWERSEDLNDKFESNFPLFGTKSSLKLARFCVALASQIMNVDESYENIIVTKEIVDYVVDYLDANYDNELFKLADYKREYDSYNICEQKDIEALQRMYGANANLFEYLDKTSVTSMETLKANSGVDGKDFNILYAQLSQTKMIRSLGRSITPTPKFRKAIKRIDKTNTTINAAITSKVFKI